MTRYRLNHEEGLLNLKMTIEDWLKTSQVTISGTGAIMQDGRMRGRSKVLRDLGLNMHGWLQSTGRLYGIGRDILEETFDLVLDEQAKLDVDATRAKLQYDPALETEGQYQLSRWLKVALCRPVDLLEIAAINHFVWQIKRKLAGLPVDYHIMPVLVGPQKTGKSRSVQHFLKPMASLLMQGRPIDSVVDERNAANLSKHYVVLFDEMARASKTDVERLKEVISIDQLDYRPLYTNENDRVKQNATFIGTSNKSLIEIIHDPSGMRRFFEFECERSLTTEERREQYWSQMPTDDEIMTAWRSIDEKLPPAHFLALEEEFNRKQEQSRSKTSAEEFLEEIEITPGPTRIALNDIYTQYQEYCRIAGINMVAQRTNFARELRNRGFESTRSSSGTVFFLSHNPKQQPKTKMMGEC